MCLKCQLVLCILALDLPRSLRWERRLQLLHLVTKIFFIPIHPSNPSRIFLKRYFLSLINPQTHPGYSSKDILDPYSTIKPIQNIFQNLNCFHKVWPGRSLPLFLLSLLHLWSGKSFIGKHPKNDYRVNLLAQKNLDAWDCMERMKRSFFCLQEEEDCQHCYSGPGLNTKLILVVFLASIWVKSFDYV